MLCSFVCYLEFFKPLVPYGKMKVESRNFFFAFLRSFDCLLQCSHPTGILELVENCWVKNMLGDNPVD